jgi:cyanophycinase
MKPQLVFAAAILAGSLYAQAPEYGPAKGTLLIQGGGSDVGTGIFETFINLAGGLDAKIVVVPTNGGNRDKNGKLIVYKEEQVLASWKKRGATNVFMLHTADCVDSYANTLTEREFHKVLERGGVIGGSSAGATIQGDYLVRGAVSGSEIMMAPEPEHQHGFAFLRKSAIDQHINTRNRWDDLDPVIKKYPDLLGIGISEGTAIVVTGDKFEVIGKWKVAVHDNTRVYQPWEKPYFVLQLGDVYNMKSRKVEKYGIGSPVPVTEIKKAEITKK